MKKVYIGIKFYSDYRNKAIVEKLTSIFENKGYETSCIVRDYKQGEQSEFSPNELMKATFEQIDLCDLVIIDLTEKGVGLGIESGYAFAKGIPILTVAKKGSDISETIAGISKDVFIYDNLESLDSLFCNFG